MVEVVAEVVLVVVVVVVVIRAHLMGIIKENRKKKLKISFLYVRGGTSFYTQTRNQSL